MDRATFPRHKTCGDWIPLNAVAELDRLGLNRQAIELQATERAAINVTAIVSPDGRVSRAPGRALAYCVPRFVFDHMLWGQAVSAGCRPIHRSIKDVTVLTREYAHVIDARGAHAGRPNAVALRAYWTVSRRVLWPGDEETVQIHTDPRFRRGYGWMFPVAVTEDTVRMNVGVGLWAADSVRGRSITDFYQAFIRHNLVLRSWTDGADIQKPVGCHVGLGVDPQAVHGDGVLRIGDAANLADPLTGDGIANAVLSGRLVAEAITGATSREDAAKRWQEAHDTAIVPELRRARRLQRLLTTTLAKNMAAGALARSASLRTRVHAAFFGEAPYAGLTQRWL